MFENSPSLAYVLESRRGVVINRIPTKRIIEARRLLVTVNLEDKLYEALDIIEKEYREKPWLLSGKSSAFLLSGLIYIIARENGKWLTQQEIADSFGCTPVTVRHSYQFWVSTLGIDTSRWYV